MTSFIIFRGIQNQIGVWKFEGIFLIALPIVAITTLLTTTIFDSYSGKFIVVFLGIILIYILRYLSEKIGVKGIKKILGKRGQAELIISTNSRFSFGLELRSPDKNDKL